MIVMEILGDPWVCLADVRGRQRHQEGLRQKIHAFLATLHQRGIVHGDLRDTNILVQQPDFEKFMLIDFDWAGLESEVKYPKFINTQVTRPLEARDCEPIIAAHDLFMLENMFAP